MKNLEELGLTPIEKEQTRTINGGSFFWCPAVGPVISIFTPEIIKSMYKN